MKHDDPVNGPAADSHDERLASLVRPAEWANPVPAGRYDLVVIGAGPAGLVAAAGAAGLGAKVALIERHSMGGDCLNHGCVPSKAILSSARAAAAMRGAASFGVNAEGVAVDFAGVMSRMRRLRSELAHHDSVSRFASLGVDVFLGAGRFVGPRRVAVGDAVLDFSKAVICTGTRPALPSLEGLDSVPYLTNETVFSLSRLPARLAVIGAGPVGCELAQAFSRLGSKVFLFTSRRGILPDEESEAVAVVREQLMSEDIEVFDCGKHLKLSRSTSDGVRLQGPHGELSVDRLLVAVGRAPNIDGLELSSAGIEASANGVRIDDFFRTTNRHVFAAGDVCSTKRFTHAADFMARAVIRNAFFFGRAKLSSMVIPWCIYTSPELARVGVIPAEAERLGLDIDTFTQPMTGNDRAVLEGIPSGMVRIHVKKGTERIVGATIVGPNAGDLIGPITMAMTHKIGLGALAGVIHPYPTFGESIRKAGDLYQRTRLTPRVAAVMKRIIRWRR